MIPGVPPDEDGDYFEHTPYLGLSSDGIHVVRCGGPTIETMHQGGSFNNLFEWAEHVCCGVEVERLRKIIIDGAVDGYCREKGLSQ